MAGSSRQTQRAGKAQATCGIAAAAHIDHGAAVGARGARNATQGAPCPATIGRGAGTKTVGGGDLDDPRLFYFRALLGSGWFFGDEERV